MKSKNSKSRQNVRVQSPVRTLRGWLVTVTLLALASVVLAQSYSVDWWKVAGGGGTSTGGVYSATVTIGQPDASAPMTNGQYSAVGGFWALPVVVPTEGAPKLSIAWASAGQVRISWTPAAAGFALQSKDTVASTNWVAAPSGTNNPAIVPASAAARFYRLQKVGL